MCRGFFDFFTGIRECCKWIRLIWLALCVGLVASCDNGESVHPHESLPTVLIILAHPDDETMFNLGRFKERGWKVSAVLVTCGENGSVVQGIKPDYDPEKDEDILIEKDPGQGTWLTEPPDGPIMREIRTKEELANERKSEFIASLSFHRAGIAYFLSDPEKPQFEDSWDNGINNWDVELLSTYLTDIAVREKPDVIITLNTDETWGHKQHYGLGRIVRDLLDQGAFDVPGQARPQLYGIREHGWYVESWAPMTGDIRFDRDDYSDVLAMSYEDYWAMATGFYISQASQTVWFSARVRAGILPGYANTDIIRRLDGSSESGLDVMFQIFPPDPAKMEKLPLTPRIVNWYR